MFVTASLSTLMPLPVRVVSAHLVVTDARRHHRHPQQQRVPPEPECALPLPASAATAATERGGGTRLHPRDVVQHVFRVRLSSPAAVADPAAGAAVSGSGSGPVPQVQARLVVAYALDDATRVLAEQGGAAPDSRTGAATDGIGSWASGTVPLASVSPVAAAWHAISGALSGATNAPRGGAAQQQPRMVPCAGMDVQLSDVPDRLQLNPPANVRARSCVCVCVCVCRSVRRAF